MIRFSVDWKESRDASLRAPRNPNDSAYDFAKSDDVIERATALGYPGARDHRTHVRPGRARRLAIAHTTAPRHMSDLENFSYAVGVRYCGKFRDTDGTTCFRA